MTQDVTVRATDEQRELWEQIRTFNIDPAGDAVLPFERRLVRENDWTPAFARRVIEEYRKFVFLAMVAGHPVTPSDQVDQAWHLHLTYTRSYWERLCGEVLPRPLHHEPTQGGEDEQQKFDDWYTRTGESYERFFGHPPPVDVWPPKSVRFGDDLHWQRVNSRRHWIVPKPRTTVAKVIGLSALSLGVAGCGAVIVAQGTQGPSRTDELIDSTLQLAIFMLVVFAIIAAVVVLSYMRNGGGKGGGCAAGGCGGGGCGGCGGGCGG